MNDVTFCLVLAFPSALPPMSFSPVGGFSLPPVSTLPGSAVNIPGMPQLATTLPGVPPLPSAAMRPIVTTSAAPAVPSMKTETSLTATQTVSS